MIKDKISCDLKNEIIENNLKSRHDGLERGFHICIGKDKKLYPHEIKCVGESCMVVLRGTCPNQMQGTYHVHPLVQESIKDTKEVIGEIPSEEETAEYISRSKMKYILKQTIPSQLDLANAINDVHEKRSHGTVCIGTDFRPNIIDCWTVKKDANLDIEISTLEEFKGLFEREKIDLRKIKC